MRLRTLAPGLGAGAILALAPGGVVAAPELPSVSAPDEELPQGPDEDDDVSGSAEDDAPGVGAGPDVVDAGEDLEDVEADAQADVGVVEDVGDEQHGPALEPSLRTPRADRAPPTAAEPAAAPLERTWHVGGFADVAYLVNSNSPNNHLYRGTVTTPRTGEFTLNLAAVYLTHAPVEAEPWRLEIGLQFGAGTDALYAAEPIPGGDDGRLAGVEVWKHVALANAGGKIERTGTELGAGLFASPIGIGGFWSRYNWNYSPSWESNAAPFYLMGARVVQDLPAGFGVQGWVVNGWQTMGDINKAPAYLAGVTWQHGDFGAAQFVYFGPDDVDLAPRAWRVHSDTQATWDAGRMGVGVVWDYGQERVTSLPDEPVHVWSGGGVFVHGLVYEARRFSLDLAARPDAWYDRNGRIYGVPQWLLSGTGTVNMTFFDALLVRAEYRYDHSTADGGFFYAKAATADDSINLASEQHTVLLSIAGYFDHAFGIRRDAAEAAR